MPIHSIRYDKDYHPGMLGIGEFLLSGQLRDAVRQGADDVATIANGTAVSKLRGEYHVESGPDVVVTKNGNRRLSEHVRNDHSAAAAIEFGSGKKDGGRPQGGSSEPFRTLGKAGARVADRLGESDD